MRIYSDDSLRNFNAWSGGADTLNELTYDEIDTIESILENSYPDGMSDTELNDFLWFENDQIADWLGYTDWDELCSVHRDG